MFAVLDAAVSVDVDVQPDAENGHEGDDSAEFEHQAALPDGAGDDDTAAEVDERTAALLHPALECPRGALGPRQRAAGRGEAPVAGGEKGGEQTEESAGYWGFTVTGGALPWAKRSAKALQRGVQEGGGSDRKSVV